MSEINESANREIGVLEVGNEGVEVPKGGPGWHWRGYLPHFDRAEVTQHVTFHLADSLAKEVLARMERELRAIPLHLQEVERRKRIEAWIDAGHGSCVLRDPAVAAMTRDALLFFQGQRYDLIAWVIMPNHVHALFQPIRGWTVARIVASWKKFTAKQISEHRKTLRNATHSIGGASGYDLVAKAIKETGESANQEIGVPERLDRIWHREYWDRYIRDESHFQDAVDYIHNNPVKAGLVARAEDWLWSSAYPGDAGKGKFLTYVQKASGRQDNPSVNRAIGLAKEES